MVELLADSEIYRFQGIFERRISYIRGDSGTGKSGLVYFLSEGRSVVPITCNKEISVITSSESNYRVKTEKNRIFFIDDMPESEDADWFDEEVLRMLIKNDSYIVMINRADAGIENKLKPFQKDVLVMRSDGIDHWLERMEQREDE